MNFARYFTEQQYDYAAELEKALTYNKSRLGRCYELSGQFMLNGGDDIDRPKLLIHGRIENFGKGVDHGWIVGYTDQVWEPITAQWFHPDFFKSWFHPIVYQSYTRIEALTLAVQFGHWGPWSNGES